MKRSFARSPYLWTILGVAAVVAAAWAGRENYQPVITGAVAPDFVVTAMDGSQVSVSDYRGKIVLLNVWATWCAPCREEMPSMQRLYDDLSRDDFEILAVSIDAPFGETDIFGRAGGDLVGFAQELGLTFPLMKNHAGDIQRVYQTTGVPESFVIDKEGVIFKKVAGSTSWDAPANKELILRLLGS
jgi:cytochrome c biogenesis protein CcmG, thiol:disulfide interchange protein DsbE